MSRKRRTFTDAEKAEAVRWYLAGENSVQIGNAVGVDSSTVRIWVLEAGYKVRSISEARGVGEDKQKEVVKRYLSGENSHQIAKSLDVSSSSVSNWVRDARHQMRSVSESKGVTKAKRVEAIRLIESGMSYNQAAKAVGVSQQTVNRWHHAHLASKPPSEREKALAEAIGLD